MCSHTLCDTDRDVVCILRPQPYMSPPYMPLPYMPPPYIYFLTPEFNMQLDMCVCVCVCACVWCVCVCVCVCAFVHAVLQTC